MTWFAGLAVYLQQLGADAPTASLIVLLALCSAPVVLVSMVLGVWERQQAHRQWQARREWSQRRGASKLGRLARREARGRIDG